MTVFKGMMRHFWKNKMLFIIVMLIIGMIFENKRKSALKL